MGARREAHGVVAATPSWSRAHAAATRAPPYAEDSRGAHFRDDYPDKDPEAAKFNLVVKKGADGRMQLERVPVVPLTEEHKKIVEENKA